MRETHLDAEVPAIDIVAEEEIPRVRGVAADLEELHEIELCLWVSACQS